MNVAEQLKQEALKGFTTGQRMTSQTRTSVSPLLSLAFQKHPKLLGGSTHVTRSVTMRRNILTSA